MSQRAIQPQLARPAQLLRRHPHTSPRPRPRKPTALAMLAPASTFFFTPVEGLLGGLTLGLAAYAKLRLTGRVLGISGAVRGVVRGAGEAWRVAFLAGLLAGGLLLRTLLPSAFEVLPPAFTLQRAVLAGLLVGLGTSRGSGCTSGHGICGNARLSPRSLAATLTFMTTGALVAKATNTAAIFSLPRGIVPLEPLGSLSGTAVFGVFLLGAAAATILLLTAAAQRLTAPQRVPSKGALELELKQAGAVEETRLTAAPPTATADAQKLAALGTAADLFIGLLFALGLGVSGMLKPSKVAGFLSVLAGSWDPTLAAVMGGALLVALPGFQLALRRRTTPRCASCYELPTKTALDADLLLGAALFGAGWGECRGGSRACSAWREASPRSGPNVCLTQARLDCAPCRVRWRLPGPRARVPGHLAAAAAGAGGRRSGGHAA